MRRFLLCVCLLSAATTATVTAGCKKKSSEPTAPSASENPAEPAKRNPPNVRKVVAPITVEEVAPLLPTPEGARVIKEPTKAQYGERFEAAFCFDQGETAALGETVKTTLTSVGWGAIVMRENPNVKDRTNLTAQHPPFMMVGQLQRTADNPDCTMDKGQTLLTLTVHKQLPRPGGIPIGRQPGLMRPLPGTRPLPPGLAPVAPGTPTGSAKPPIAPAPTPRPAPVQPAPTAPTGQ